MKRRRLLLALLGGCVLLAATWLVWPKGEPPQTVRLSDESFVTMVAVTYGKKHAASVGTLRERLTRQLPAKLFPKWPRALSLRTNTERDTLVVWLYSTNWLMFNHYYVSGFVAGRNKVEFQATRILARGLGASKGALIGMAVDAFPRREESFTLRLGNPQAYLPVATLTVRNPARSRAKPWGAPPLPQRAETKEFECELEQCELNLNRGLEGPLSMTWNFYEKDARDWHWRVQKVELEDSTGNFISQLCKDLSANSSAERIDFGFVADTGPQQIDFTRSLLPRVGAWKVRAYVMRTGGFLPNEVWEVRNMPLMGQTGYRQKVWQTNISGALLKIGSPLSPARIGDASDSVLLSSDSQDVMARMSLLTLLDDQGRSGADQGTLRGDQMAVWRRKWNAGATSCTIRLGVSHWRVVEFLVEPTVIGANP